MKHCVGVTQVELEHYFEPMQIWLKSSIIQWRNERRTQKCNTMAIILAALAWCL